MLFLLICAAYLWCPSELMTAGKAFEKTFTFLHLKCWSPIVIDCLHFVPLQTLVSEGHRQVMCSWVLYLSYCHLCVLVNKQCQLWRLIKHRRVSVLGGFFYLSPKSTFDSVWNQTMLLSKPSVQTFLTVTDMHMAAPTAGHLHGLWLVSTFAW